MEAGVVPRLAPTRVPTFSSPVLLRVASDARLVALIREGRSAAFEAAYDRHYRAILSFCRHMLGDADEAEDAVQHTFAAAYTDLVTSEKPIHLRPWLFTIARNRCYSILRARREQPVAELEEVQTEGLAAQVQTREDLRDLVSDMRQLPDEQRAALVLAELDALSHEEISEALGVPKEKVKALVFQARESLIASRAARETACTEIRAQISAGRGATLRRTNLRRHLRECDGCREYRAQVDRQRRQFALLLPVVPTIALKQAVLGGTLGGSILGGGLLAPSALKSAIAKGVAGALLAGAGTAGTVVVAASDLHISGLDSPALSHHSHGGTAGWWRHGARHHGTVAGSAGSAALLSDATRAADARTAIVTSQSADARHGGTRDSGGSAVTRSHHSVRHAVTGTGGSAAATAYAVAPPTGLSKATAGAAGGVAARGGSAGNTSGSTPVGARGSSLQHRLRWRFGEHRTGSDHDHHRWSDLGQRRRRPDRPWDRHQFRIRWERWHERRRRLGFRLDGGSPSAGGGRSAPVSKALRLHRPSLILAADSCTTPRPTRIPIMAKSMRSLLVRSSRSPAARVVSALRRPRR